MTTSAKYSGVAMALHWIVAALVLYNIFFPPEPGDVSPEVRAQITALHVGLGLIIIILMALRLFWRAGHHAPALPENLAGWERKSARALHWLLYLIVFLMIGFGFATALLAPYPAAGFGVVPVAGFVTVSESTWEVVKEIHHTGNKVLQAVVYLHIAAALYHHFIKKNGVLTSMLPWGGAK